jgi:plasmid stability protein
MEEGMAQVLIRNVPEDTIESYRRKAKLNGRSLEQELRNLLEKNKPYTPEERAALTRKYLAQFDKPTPALTLDEIREGLE